MAQRDEIPCQRLYGYSVVDLRPELRTCPCHHFDVLPCGSLNRSSVRPVAFCADVHHC